MARIKVLGGTGYAGAAIVAEAVKRGHQVTSYSRSAPERTVEGASYVFGSLEDDGLLQQTVEDVDVVFETMSPRGDMRGRLEHIVGSLMGKAEMAGVRLGVLGGVSSTLVSEGGPRFFEEHPPPEEVLPEVLTGIALLDALRSAPEGLDWFYVSPAAEFGSWLPQRVTGGYRVSDDVLITDEHGDSYIAAPDLALAVLDEIENPQHRRRRFHVAL
ncbi:MAG: NAD(P)H-binding protein [Nocardioidaceae bacterium]